MIKGEKSFDEAMAESLAGIIVDQWLNPSSATFVEITDRQEFDALLAMLHLADGNESLVKGRN